MAGILSAIESDLIRGAPWRFGEGFQCRENIQQSRDCVQKDPDYKPATTGCLHVEYSCAQRWPLKGKLTEAEQEKLRGKYMGRLVFSAHGLKTFRYADLNSRDAEANERWVGSPGTFIGWRDFVRINGRWLLAQVRDYDFDGKVGEGDNIDLGRIRPGTLECPLDDASCQVLFGFQIFRFTQGAWRLFLEDPEPKHRLTSHEVETIIEPVIRAYRASLERFHLTESETAADPK